MHEALRDPKVTATLDRLHAAAKGDRWVFLRAAPAGLWSLLTGGSMLDGILPYLKDAYIPISPEQGELLYLTARLVDARTIVEFGTSFGVSALYLGAAARANGGRFFGSEREPNKIAAARAHLAEAGLADVAEVREGDAMRTFADLPAPIDLVLLDGWKDLYLPMLRLLLPKLRRGTAVFADNIFTFPRELASYVAFVRDPTNGFESTTIPLGHGLEYSVRVR
ncbi:MAG: class I SAM-dependent methyltransferase [Deltaproteobacteria bacterium]|nr:class I SAM-dependent methyltransferase [Deltaproteobacteria bacterium]